MKYLYSLILLIPVYCLSQNNVRAIAAEDVKSILSNQRKDYKLIFFWVPKCETIEQQYNDTSTLQKQVKNIVILPIAMISTKNYRDDFHNLFYSKFNLGKSLEVAKINENQYDNFDAFKERFLILYKGQNKDAFYFLFDKQNQLIKEWEDLPSEQDLLTLIR